LIAVPDGRLLGVAAGDPQVLGVTVDSQQKFNHQASYGKPMAEHRSLIEPHRCLDMYILHAEISAFASFTCSTINTATRSVENACG
jgi:hypothetical protein